MNLILFENIGCDDTTRFFIRCSDIELEFLKRLVIYNNLCSNNCCMPIIDLYKIPLYDSYEDLSIYELDDYLEEYNLKLKDFKINV